MECYFYKKIGGKVIAKHKDYLAGILAFITYLFAILSLSIMVFLVGFVLYKGLPHLTLEMFEVEYTSENLSLMPALIYTLQMTELSLLLALPTGIGTAIYLTQYGKGKFAVLVEFAVQSLAGVPSILYGMFGLLYFVTFLNMGISLLAGAFTVAIMILPIVVSTATQAMKEVPKSYLLAGHGVGVSRFYIIRKIVLPTAQNGILAGVTLCIGRIMGETAALLYTAGTATQIAKTIEDSGRTMALHIYLLSGEGEAIPQAYATSAVLVIMIIGVNTVTCYLAKRMFPSGTH